MATGVLSATQVAEWLAALGFAVDFAPGRGMSLTHLRDGFRLEIHANEWDRWDGVEALGELLKRKADEARSAKAEEERAKKLAAMGDHERRRAVFYEWEADAFQRGLVPKPEEPNVRVFARVMTGVMETARYALSSQDFKGLAQMMADEMGSIAKEGGQ